MRRCDCVIDFIGSSLAMIITISMVCGPGLYSLNNPDPKLTNLWFCKLRLYINQSASMIYRWCLTLACVDRVALSSTRVNFRRFANVNMARRIVLLIVILWLILPIHSLIVYEIRNGSCGVFISVGVSLYHSLFTTLSGSVFPVTIMMICVFLIRSNLTKKRRLRREERNSRESIQIKRDHQALLMLLTQISVYILLISPLMCYYFYSASSLYISNKSLERITIENFIQIVGETIVILFSVLSFPIYTMASTSFRHEFIRLIACQWRNSTNRIESTNFNVTSRR